MRKSRRLNKRIKSRRNSRRITRNKRRNGGTGTNKLLQNLGKEAVESMRRTYNQTPGEMSKDILTGLPGEAFAKRHPGNSKAVKGLIFGLKEPNKYEHDPNRFEFYYPKREGPPVYKIDNSMINNYNNKEQQHQDAIRKIIAPK